MPEYGVLCKMADDEAALVTVDAPDAGDARRQVERHTRLFYGGGDRAGRWLASCQPRSTITEVGEARPLAEWEADVRTRYGNGAERAR